VKFQKRPNEGRMKGLAFALDPDGYWIELVRRQRGIFQEPCNFSQVMLRVKDGCESVRFYAELMGMTLTSEMGIPNDFTNYFLMSLDASERRHSTYETMPFRLWRPALELTHNHGTEKNVAFQVHNGNGSPEGFGHVGFLVDNLSAMCTELDELGVPFFRRPAQDDRHTVAVVLDPSGYLVKLIERPKVVDEPQQPVVHAKLMGSKADLTPQLDGAGHRSEVPGVWVVSSKGVLR